MNVEKLITQEREKERLRFQDFLKLLQRVKDLNHLARNRVISPPITRLFRKPQCPVCNIQLKRTNMYLKENYFMTRDVGIYHSSEMSSWLSSPSLFLFYYQCPECDYEYAHWESD